MCRRRSSDAPPPRASTGPVVSVDHAETVVASAIVASAVLGRGGDASGSSSADRGGAVAGRSSKSISIVWVTLVLEHKALFNASSLGGFVGF